MTDYAHITNYQTHSLAQPGHSLAQRGQNQRISLSERLKDILAVFSLFVFPYLLLAIAKLLS